MKHIKGVVFDLDGTLVSCDLCFQKMREVIGCPLEEDILTFVASLDDKAQTIANRKIKDLELADAYAATWIDGAKQFIKLLASYSIPMAVITRNSREASLIKKNNNQIPIDRIISREDAPAKPDPTALISLAEEWQLAPNTLLYIGDYLYDIEIARNAGVQSALFCEHGMPEYAKDADYVFECYKDFASLFE
jgi:HAD superfamily hydrolase (TIGR01549 family)